MPTVSRKDKTKNPLPLPRSPAFFLPGWESKEGRKKGKRREVNAPRPPAPAPGGRLTMPSATIFFSKISPAVRYSKPNRVRREAPHHFVASQVFSSFPISIIHMAAGPFHRGPVSSGAWD